MVVTGWLVGEGHAHLPGGICSIALHIFLKHVLLGGRLWYVDGWILYATIYYTYTHTLCIYMFLCVPSVLHEQACTGTL